MSPSKSNLAMKGRISAVFLILSITSSSTKSVNFGKFASLYIAFGKCLKMAIFHTFENRVILLPRNVIKLFIQCNKFEMILESIKTIQDMIMKVFDDFNYIPKQLDYHKLP